MATSRLDTQKRPSSFFVTVNFYIVKEYKESVIYKQINIGLLTFLTANVLLMLHDTMDF